MTDILVDQIHACYLYGMRKVANNCSIGGSVPCDCDCAIGVAQWVEAVV